MQVNSDYLINFTEGKVMDFIEGIFTGGSAGDEVDPGYNGGIIGIYEIILDFIKRIIKILFPGMGA